MKAVRFATCGIKKKKIIIVSRPTLFNDEMLTHYLPFLLRLILNHPRVTSNIEERSALEMLTVVLDFTKEYFDTQYSDLKFCFQYAT